MSTTIPLPLLQAEDLFSAPVAPAPFQHLPRVRSVRRQGAALHPTPLAPSEDVLGLNLARGCGHRCAFCSARAYPTHPGDQVLDVYTDTVQRLQLELAARPHLRAVFVSPSTDPFPPLNAVQQVAAEVVGVLARHGVDAWLMTRGLIRPDVLKVLETHRDRVRVTVALTTLDRQLQRTWEPLSAPPRLRLRQIVRLRQLGIPVQVALDPLIPGVTDTRANLSAVLAGLAMAGVRQVTASYVFLRDGIATNLTGALAASGLAEVVLGAFRGGPVLTAPGMAAARYLPKSRRQRGYAALMALAASHAIQVSVGGLSNPDFAGPRRPAPAEEARPRLRSLFVQAGLRRERA